MATDETSPQNLHVPQSTGGSTKQSMQSIMDAYKTQSKISLYGDNSAESAGAQDPNVGVTGRDIPLSMLRPSAANANTTMDENGNVVMRRPSRGDVLREVESYGGIANAYRQMKGLPTVSNNRIPASTADLSGVKRFEADYVEDMPDTDEGLLEILELAINNAKANLEMLQSLYAALSPKEYAAEDDGGYGELTEEEP